MPLAPGTTIGPYEILGPLGAGGMGEVYRARDARLGREVAIKVLPASFVADPDRLRRFEQEARATGQLNHPNILVVYDTGTHAGMPYVVEELLEGETLRQRMSSGPLPVRKAIDYARQTALGLAAAHQKGIVHRDLKPENLFVTQDGRLKILDFGLAKLTRPEEPGAITSAPTRADTGSGIVLGTVGYMSPEQVRGQPTDQRSDLFAFGCILYEMLAGRRAFSAASSVETMNAILKEEPPEIVRPAGDLPPGLARIVQHCLEKNPEERFQSARDLGFQLEALSATAAGGSAVGAERPVGSRSVGGRARLPLWPALAGAALLAAGAYYAGFSQRPAAAAADYRQLTFRQGTIVSARFTPEGDSVVYSAAWDGSPTEIFTTRPGSPESRSLELPPAEVLSVSPSGELAILLDPHFTLGFMRTGTLARVPFGGGVPREVLQDVQDADWAPNGQGLAVIHGAGGRYRLEYPIGTPLYETTAWISSIRFSRDGKRIAFVDHPGLGDNRGRVAVTDLAGNVAFLTEPFAAAGGLAWPPSGDEIWFTAGTVGMVRALNAVDLQGRLRTVDGVPADIHLSDISRDGRVLLERNTARRGIVGTRPGDDTERDLGWLDWSRPGALSRDGQWLLFEEQGQGGGERYSVYLRSTDGSPPMRLGEGFSNDLSDDGQWALTIPNTTLDRLVFIPRGAGEPRTVMLGALRPDWAQFLPGDRRLLVAASEPSRGQRLFVMDLDGGNVRAIAPEGTDIGVAASPDGLRVATTINRGPVQIFPVEGGEPVPVPGSLPGDVVISWARDGRSILVSVLLPGARRVDRIDLASGRRTPWKTLAPADKAGLVDVSWVLLSDDERSYVYSYRRLLSTLYLVDGLR